MADLRRVKLMRGNESTRNAVVPEQGEQISTIDELKVYLGDGIKPGGYVVNADNTIAICKNQSISSTKHSLAWWINWFNGSDATIRIPKGIHNISTNMTVPSNICLKFDKGAYFNVASGVTLTVNGDIDAGIWEVYTGSGTVNGTAYHPTRPEMPTPEYTDDSNRIATTAFVKDVLAVADVLTYKGTTDIVDGQNVYGVNALDIINGCMSGDFASCQEIYDGASVAALAVTNTQLIEIIDRLNAHIAQAAAALAAKVDKVIGKELSDENYTTAEKDKLAGIAQGAQVNAVTSVSGKIGAVTLVKADVGLSNVDNTSDANKPVSTATQTALNAKIATAEKGAINGVATLGSNTKIPVAQLPQSTTDAIGAVELATTAEATAGTDTVRAVTAAGVKGYCEQYGLGNRLQSFYANINNSVNRVYSKIITIPFPVNWQTSRCTVLINGGCSIDNNQPHRILLLNVSLRNHNSVSRYFFAATNLSWLPNGENVGYVINANNSVDIYLYTTGYANDTTVTVLHNNGCNITLSSTFETTMPTAYVSIPIRNLYTDYNAANILGTVSATGTFPELVPTGGIIQTITNNNGVAIRYANGIQQCYNPDGTAITTDPAAFIANTVASIDGGKFKIGRWI